MPVKNVFWVTLESANYPRISAVLNQSPRHVVEEARLTDPISSDQHVDVSGRLRLGLNTKESVTGSALDRVGLGPV